MSQLQVTCPGCAAKINYPEAKAGTSAKCPRCKEPISLPPPLDAFAVAVESGIAEKAAAPEMPERWDPTPVPSYHSQTRKKPSDAYWGLRLIAVINRVIGWLFIIVGVVLVVLAGIAVAMVDLSPIEFVGGFVFLPAIIISGVTYIAFAELISLFIGIADDTRRQSELLEQVAANTARS